MIIKEYIKVNWHSLINFHKNFKDESHRVSSIKQLERFADGTQKVTFERYFCECGYNDDDSKARKIMNNIMNIRRN